MAKVDFNVLGNYRNKVGNVVGYTRMGEQTMRGYLASISNPNTQAQQLYRGRFAILASLAASFRRAINLGLKPAMRAAKSSVYGEFIKLNQAAVTGTVGALNVVPDSIKVSKGSLMEVALGSPNFSTPLTVTVPVTDNYADIPDVDPTDVCYLAVYSPDYGRVLVSAGAPRGTQAEPIVSLTAIVPSSFQGVEVHLYAFVVAADGSLASQTTYLGSGEIA